MKQTLRSLVGGVMLLGMTLAAEAAAASTAAGESGRSRPQLRVRRPRRRRSGHGLYRRRGGLCGIPNSGRHPHGRRRTDRLRRSAPARQTRQRRHRPRDAPFGGRRAHLGPDHDGLGRRRQHLRQSGSRGSRRRTDRHAGDVEPRLRPRAADRKPHKRRYAGVFSCSAPKTTDGRGAVPKRSPPGSRTRSGPGTPPARATPSSNAARPTKGGSSFRPTTNGWKTTAGSNPIRSCSSPTTRAARGSWEPFRSAAGTKARSPNSRTARCC